MSTLWEYLSTGDSGGRMMNPYLYSRLYRSVPAVELSTHMECRSFDLAVNRILAKLGIK